MAGEVPISIATVYISRKSHRCIELTSNDDDLINNSSNCDSESVKSTELSESIATKQPNGEPKKNRELIKDKGELCCGVLNM